MARSCHVARLCHFDAPPFLIFLGGTVSLPGMVPTCHFLLAQNPPFWLLFSAGLACFPRFSQSNSWKHKNTSFRQIWGKECLINLYTLEVLPKIPKCEVKVESKWGKILVYQLPHAYLLLVPKQDWNMNEPTGGQKPLTIRHLRQGQWEISQIKHTCA